MPFKPMLKPFYHGVASGDPLSDKVIIWTRVTPEADSTIHVKYYVATDTSFTNIVKSGEVTTDSTKDYTVKVDVEGLSAGKTYFYFFKAIGANSLIGRTKTVPVTDNINGNLKFAVVSCNNYEGGFFNAYGRIAERHDIDAVIHLGDYIYEYAPGQYRDTTLKNRNSNLAPAKEIVNQADYRLRYSVYRLDPDLQAAHQQHPFITVWDDHESANDSYKDGADNHTEGAEGVWANRKALAKKVYFEWMPIRNHPDQKIYRKVSYGNLMDLFMLDTRLEGRDKPPVNFDDADQGRKMISQEQFNWLIDGLKTSTAKWKVVGNQAILSVYNVGFAAARTGNPAAPTILDSIRLSENLFIDDWRGYTAQRGELIDSIDKKKINNVIIVTGDSHCTWAFDVTKNPNVYPGTFNLPQASATYNRETGAGSVAVEFGTPGISSQNFDESIGLQSALGFQSVINKAIATPFGNVYYNPHLKHVDLVQQGYMVLDIKKDSSQTDWFYVLHRDSTSKAETTGNVTSRFTSARVLNGSNKVKIDSIIAARKPVMDIPAPKFPASVITGFNLANAPAVVFSLYPNPASDHVLLNYGVAHSALVETELLDGHGKRVKKITKPVSLSSGNYVQEFDVSDLKPGIYFVKITTDGHPVTWKLVVQ